MPTVREVTRFLDLFAPRDLAAEWDNVGLLLGESDTVVERIMTCLTVTPDVVAEAVSEQVNLIVSHHPVMFRGVKMLSSESDDGRLLLPLLANRIAVYSPHTAFDNCTGGINDQLAMLLGLKDVTPLKPHSVSSECKLVVFVPEADLASVSDALFRNGAGIIGGYEKCSFRVSGLGTFFGMESTNPAVGEKGRFEEVAEARLEVRVPLVKLDAVLAAMKQAHSYEEPAYDVYPLAPVPCGGEGRIGNCAGISLAELAKSVQTSLKANVVHVVGDPLKPVSRVAVACGAAGEFLKDAIRAKADAFLTGEVRFHDCLTAEAAGVALILPGHYATERPAVEVLAEILTNEFRDTKAWASRRERDPLVTLTSDCTSTSP